MRPSNTLFIVLALFFLTGPACAHPVPRDSHDRFIQVTLLDCSKPGLVRVNIVYRLEVDELTVVLEDMRDYRDEVDPALFAKNGLIYYAEYARIYADIIARNLRMEVNGRVVPLHGGERSQTLKDEKTNEPLGHVRCVFHFEAEFAVRPTGENFFEVRETNFRDQNGQINFSFDNQASIRIDKQDVPDPELNKLPPLQRPIDFDARMRQLNLQFVSLRIPFLGASNVGRWGTFDAFGSWYTASEMMDGMPRTHTVSTGKDIDKAAPLAEPAATIVEHTADHSHERRHDHDEFLTIYRGLRESGAGFWFMLLIFAGLGAAHALTPGHGKTLVAAYLVGQHGTVWHAVLLGLVTTITHTGSVLILAIILGSITVQARQSIHTGLGLALGISVACLGFWLLLQRLSGRADHVHLGGGHHHHHSHGGPPNPSSDKATKKPLGLGGIILLGMNGGLIPCWDAVAILAWSAGTSEFWLALPALLAFSAGLAAVLVVIGILVVQVRNFAGSKWGEGRFVRMLPLVSAVVVTCMGLYLCFVSLPSE